MGYSKYQDLTITKQLNKVLRDQVFKIASNPKDDGYQRALASMVFKFFDKKTKGNGVNFMPNNSLKMNFINQLSENSKEGKFILPFKDNIWGVDLADMQLISK